MPRFIVRSLARDAYCTLSKRGQWSMTKNKDEATRFNAKWEAEMFMRSEPTAHEVENVSN